MGRKTCWTITKIKRLKGGFTMSAILNIREGIRQQAEERARKQAEKQADIQNKQEKEEHASEENKTPDQMTPEQMQEHITLLSKAVLDLTAKLEGKGE
jgi:hypothetical protein